MKRLALAVVFISAMAVSAYAYRPFVTEDAGVAGKGVIQLETSWDYLDWDNDDAEHVLLFVPIYGITERLELSTEIPYLFHEQEDGIGDINVVGKFLMLNETEKFPAFTLKGILKTSSGDADRGLGSGDLDYSIVLVTSKGFGSLTLHGMLGYTFVGDNGEEDVRDIHLYGLAADYGLTEKLHIVGEISGNRHPDRNIDDDPLSGLLGVTYQVSEKVILDGGVRYGFNDSVPEWNYTLGMSITF